MKSVNAPPIDWSDVERNPAPLPPGGDATEAEREGYERRSQGALHRETEWEYLKLRARAAATERFRAEQAAQAKKVASEKDYIKDGAAFLLDAPAATPAIWGRGDDVLWAEGESLLIAGGQGVGKTTVAGQLLAGCLGVLPEVLGFPVRPARKRVLYLAMDRPKQAARNLARIFRGAPRELLAEKLVVWQGPPPADLAQDPDAMYGMCDMVGADVLFVDSLKDAAMGLSSEEGGGGYNRARQRCIQNGIDLLELHHQRKTGENGGKPKTISDVYGSTWITSGAGSVIVLFGDPGDPMVEFIHLKQPVNVVGPFNIIHDQQTGISRIHRDDTKDVLIVARRCASTGMSVKEAAQVMTGSDTPDAKDVEKARRELQKHEKAGRLASRKADGGVGRGNEMRWFPVGQPDGPTGEAPGDAGDVCEGCGFGDRTTEHAALCVYAGRPTGDVARLIGEDEDTVIKLLEINGRAA